MKLINKHKKTWRIEFNEELKFLLKKSFNKSWHDKRIWRACQLSRKAGQVKKVPSNESKKYRDQGFLIIGLYTENGTKIYELVNKQYFLNNL